MTAKFTALLFLLPLFSNTALADDRIGHYDSLRMMSDDQTNYVDIKAPASFTTWTATLPADDGTAGQVLSTDGSGILSWLTPPDPNLPQALGETLDPLDSSSTRYNIQTTVTPSIDSPSSTIVELQAEQNLTGTHPINTSWLASLRHTNSGSADEGRSGIMTSYQQVGNGTDPVTLSTQQIFDSYVAVQAGSDIGSAQAWQHSINAPAGTTVGNVGFIREASTIDHVTASYNGVEVQGSFGDIDGIYRGFLDNSAITNVDGGIQNFRTANTWTMVTGGIDQFAAAPTIGTANSTINTFADYTQVGNMPTLNTNYTSLNFGPSLTGSTYGFNSFSTHPQVATVLRDFNAWEDGSNVTTVGRNVNFMNHHPNVTTVVDNYTGYGASPQVTTSHGSFADIQLNSKVISLANNYQGISLNPQMTAATPTAYDVTLTPQADVSGSMAGVYFGLSIPYAVGGDSFTPWLQVSGVGTAPGGQPNPIQVNVATNDSAATIATAIYAALSGYGAPLSTNLTFTDLGGSIQIVANATGAANKLYLEGNPDPTVFTATYATYGAGGGSATGINVNMSQVSGYDGTQGKLQAINFNQGTFTGNMTFPFTNVANVTPINSINLGLTAAANATVANADTFAYATLQNLSLGANATITSGAFGVGSASSGGINLLQMDNGSTIADVAGSFQAFVPIGGSGAGGVVGTMHGYEFAGIPGAVTGSPTTVTNAKAFEARAPAGPFTTGTAWGLWAQDSFTNYMGGSLKVGSGSDTPTRTLDVQGDAEIGDTKRVVIKSDGRVKFASFTTTERNALPSPEAGDTIFNSDTGSLEYYDGSTWL